MKILIIFPLIAIASSLSIIQPIDIENEWQKFKTEFRPNEYNGQTGEESIRRQIFETNYRLIVNHNREADMGYHTYRLGVNQFADLTNEEYKQRLGLDLSSFTDKDFDTQSTIDNKIINDLPKSVDWREKHVVSRVKDQLDCGFCYAFSTIDTIESQLAIKTGKITELSLQNVVDCIYPGKLHFLNCFTGGYMHQAFEQIIDMGGVESVTTSPYHLPADAFNCSYRGDEYRAASIEGYVNVTSGDEVALQQAVATVGPVAVAIDASNDGFKFYKSGVYSDPNCKQAFHDLHHAVVVVGYGTTDDGQDYWIIKNSYNTTYGDQGYIKIARNKSNMCGVATYAVYPTGVSK